MDDLRKLIDAVEGGGLTAFDCGKYGSFLAPYCNGHTVFLTTLLDAYNGSLDAAKELHEALLPGWDYIVARTNGGLTTYVKLEQETTFNDCPARAWLLAILKAYESQQ